MFNSANLISNPKNSFGINYVEIDKLPEGTYRIWFKKEEKMIVLNVFSGKYWNINSDFIIQER